MASNGTRANHFRERRGDERAERSERPDRPPRSERPRRPDRPVLDQAIAINGDLRVQLFGLNLLPIKVRLLVSSKDVAAELGLDWWRRQNKQRGKTKKRRREDGRPRGR